MRTTAGLRVVVTGATGGIGRALVERLAADGARVAVTGRSVDRLAALASLGGVDVSRPAEASDEQEIADFFAATTDQLGGLDVLITLAGASVPGAIEHASLADLEALLRANLTSTVLACKHAIPRLADDGMIVSVGSLAGHRPNSAAPLYCTSKAAVAMFGATLALQLADRGIRVCQVTPGGVDTEFWGERPVDRARLLAATDVVEAIMFVLALPPHVIVRDLQFESTGRSRS